MMNVSAGECRFSTESSRKLGNIEDFSQKRRENHNMNGKSEFYWENAKFNRYIYEKKEFYLENVNSHPTNEQFQISSPCMPYMRKI